MWRPLDDRLLVRMDSTAGEKTSAGGVILAGDADAPKLLEVDVLATGPNVKDVAVGARVLISAFAGVTLAGSGELERFVKEADVVAVVS